jgi:hypothetical protein
MKNMLYLRNNEEVCMKLEMWEESCDAHMLNAAGVYAILDEDDNVMYVGQTDCFIVRWADHCKKSRTDRHVPPKHVFRFVVLAYEDDRGTRLNLEEEYTLELEPKYGKAVANAWKPRDVKLNPAKIRALNRVRPERPHLNQIEDYEDHNEALEDELRYLNRE